MADIIFERTGANKNGSIPGKITIDKKTWETIERGKAYTFVRKGEYTVKMDTKRTGETVQCLRFSPDCIDTHLIHRAKDDLHTNLSGCIAPGKSCDEEGIHESEKAMNEIFEALGNFREGQTKTIEIQNNIDNQWRNETKEEWLKRLGERCKGK